MESEMHNTFLKQMDDLILLKYWPQLLQIVI